MNLLEYQDEIFSFQTFSVTLIVHTNCMCMACAKEKFLSFNTNCMYECFFKIELNTIHETKKKQYFRLENLKLLISITTLHKKSTTATTAAKVIQIKTIR